MEKMLITGASGFLGARIAAFYARKYDVLPCSHEKLDITNPTQVLSLFQQMRPQYVVHCAAVSDTGYAEKYPEQSYAINVNGAVHIAAACAAVNAKLIFMSSDQIYNGNSEKGALRESTSVCPVSVYGRHKLAAEQKVLEILPDAVALRLTWMYDVPESPYKLNRNLICNLLAAAQTSSPISFSVHEYRGITDVWQIVKAIEACFSLPGGIYNAGSKNDKTTYETAMVAAEKLGIFNREKLVLPDVLRYETQPRNLSINTEKIKSFGVLFPNTCDGFPLKKE